MCFSNDYNGWAYYVLGSQLIVHVSFPSKVALDHPRGIRFITTTGSLLQPQVKILIAPAFSLR